MIIEWVLNIKTQKVFLLLQFHEYQSSSRQKNGVNNEGIIFQLKYFRLNIWMFVTWNEKSYSKYILKRLSPVKISLHVII